MGHTTPLVYNLKCTGWITYTIGKVTDTLADSSKEICREVNRKKPGTLLCYLLLKKGKGKVYPITGHDGPNGV
jgi:hypothetical protein